MRGERADWRHSHRHLLLIPLHLTIDERGGGKQLGSPDLAMTMPVTPDEQLLAVVQSLFYLSRHSLSSFPMRPLLQCRRHFSSSPRRVERPRHSAAMWPLNSSHSRPTCSSTKVLPPAARRRSCQRLWTMVQ